MCRIMPMCKKRIGFLFFEGEDLLPITRYSVERTLRWNIKEKLNYISIFICIIGGVAKFHTL